MIIENYTLIKILKKTKNSSIWLSEHNENQKQYAIKIVQIERANAYKMFKNEQNLLLRCNHPNIIHIHESGELSLPKKVNYCKWIPQKIGYLVLDLLPYTLIEYINIKGILSELETMYFARDISEAVKYLHDNSIAHRDLSYHNVMINNNAILIDLGISIDEHNHKCDKCSNTISGTVRFISPEQMNGAYGNIQQNDIYSIGCLIHFMLTGKFTHKQQINIIDFIKDKKHNIPYIVYENKKNISQDIFNLIRDMLLPSKYRINIDYVIQRINTIIVNLQYDKCLIDNFVR